MAQQESAAARGRGRPRAGEELDTGPLLMAALDAFAETGYDGTSVRALSRRLGISHALFTARFGSKEQLWYAAMEHALAPAEQVWKEAAESPESDDLETLRQGIIRQVLFAAAHPQVARIMNHEGAVDSPRIRFVVDRFINPLRPGVERLLDRLVAAGRIRPLPYATLHYLVTNGGCGQFTLPVKTRLLGADLPATPAELREHAETVADILLTGITVKPE
ncbi:TetR/AcrR family transcriptional regulator [Streptomyces sp. A7024]|uniref:TetR/AcrR family transcriptional regulator n=1 Tax=Streptomyces coryli TaxID=1128680 RepID=A0A6G4U2Y7_9ACTN|nr:TetR/AcrR family transcriptional regulator [Streptomyces coryli]NGN66372.1 TetR/AcrR family transcriptional regulator [Streptomyces coryli]